MSFPAGDTAEVPLEGTALAGAARFLGAGLAGHRAQGLCLASAPRPVGLGTLWSRTKRIPGQLPSPDHRALAVRPRTRSCLCGAGPQAPDLRGLLSRPSAQASPPPCWAPWAEKGEAGTGPGIGAHDPKKWLSLSNLSGHFDRGGKAADRYPGFSRRLIFKLCI